jgi:hypothetical protein
MSEQLLNLPDSFEDWDSAEKHLITCCELLGVKVQVSSHLPVKNRIYLYCRALEIDHLDIYDRVKRGRDEDGR